MPWDFHANHAWLTYARCSITKEQYLAHLQTLDVAPHIAYYTIAEELHEDGTPHLHVVLSFSKKWRTRNERYFDLDETYYIPTEEADINAPDWLKPVHPNWVSPGKAWATKVKYAREDGNYLSTHEISDQLKWADLVESTTKAAFLEAVRKAYPRDYVLSLERIEYYAEKHYANTIPPYDPPDYTYFLPVVLSDWILSEFSHPRRERPKSLYICGASRTGKTSWARSLGRHIYFGQAFDLQQYDPLATYAVFDDIGWEQVKYGWKGWLGAQKQFTCSDKYRKKTQIAWGKPTIVCVNQDEDWRDLMTRKQLDWFEANVITCIIPEGFKLYQ